MILARDTALRYLAILQILPTYPKKYTVKEIIKRLESDEISFHVSKRTIQRDLDELSKILPVCHEEEGRIYYWFLNTPLHLTNIPEMSASTALALRLVSEYVSNLLPSSALNKLTPFVNLANQILKESKFGLWSKRVHLINTITLLIPPQVDNKIQSAVYEALLENKQIVIKYKNRSRGETTEYKLQPFGILVKNGVFYLIAGSGGHETPNQYCLHRIIAVHILKEINHIPHNFDIRTYSEQSQPLSYPHKEKSIRLHVVFDTDTGFHLTESRISEDQIIKQLSDGRWAVIATVSDTSQLRWWLHGFSSKVEIRSPRYLRTVFKNESIELSRIYK